MAEVTIINYGMGNILSVRRALEHSGAEVKITSEPKDITNAKSLILPGVGAFADGIKGLEERDLMTPIMKYAESGRLLLGICLGMQMLFEESEEFGLHKGLGLIPGKVIQIEKTTANGQFHKIPHIGWNALRVPDGKDISLWKDTLMEGIDEDSNVYFVHSYKAVLEKDEYMLANSYYGGREITAVVRKGNISGCQFHPEKSGRTGLDIIKNFIRISELG